ncbi:baseplate J/gp47 family protein [Paenibacillus sp. 7124]|uniref:Baseplate J/gp47 family protein n=1 Tax=Paenibacillus apii TaxID=1850370 RepID=A0A6M1PDC4_9BACL|nr:baseplate J/gp47 family protein [Paenibacillus apii]NGM81280.1 baseplate J/gp47 family protein [Paenibacillus apii]
MATLNDIYQQLINQISDDYDKTEGYLISDMMRSVSIVFADLYTKQEEIESLLDVDKLSGDQLTKFVLQRRGIKRNEATYAVGQVSVTGNGAVNIGDLFEVANGIQFRATETKTITDNGIVNIECVTAGSVGNVPANQIRQMPVTLSGITAVTNPVATHDGYEAETDNILRTRYYESLQQTATSGNVSHYKAWAKSISGVGSVKVFPVDNGVQGGIAEVDIVIIDQDKLPASTTLVSEVQEYIDPNSEGLGYGQAPIGAKCYVYAATTKTLDITLSITKSSEYTDAQVLQNITDSITSYIEGIAFQTTYVSEAKIGSAILDSAGVEDYSNLLINGQSGNVTVGEREVPFLGDVAIV